MIVDPGKILRFIYTIYNLKFVQVIVRIRLYLNKYFFKKGRINHPLPVYRNPELKHYRFNHNDDKLTLFNKPLIFESIDWININYPKLWRYHLHYFDYLENRLSLAKIFGAKNVYNVNEPFPQNWPNRSFDDSGLYRSGIFDIIVDCAAVSSSLNNSIKLLKKDGSIILVGEPSKSIELDIISLKYIILGEINIKGSCGYLPKDFSSAIDALSKHLIDYKKIITKKAKLKDIQKTFDYYLKNKNDQIKVLIESS